MGAPLLLQNLLVQPYRTPHPEPPALLAQSRDTGWSAPCPAAVSPASPGCSCLISLQMQHNLFPSGLTCPTLPASPSSPGVKDRHALGFSLYIGRPEAGLPSRGMSVSRVGVGVAVEGA